MGRGRLVAFLIAAVSSAAGLFHMYAAGYEPFTALVQRPIHLALMSVLGFLGVGVQRKLRHEGVGSEGPTIGERVSQVTGWVFAVLSVIACAYLVFENQELVQRSGSPTQMDLVMGAITILLVLELARRATGWGLIAVCFTNPDASFGAQLLGMASIFAWVFVASLIVWFILKKTLGIRVSEEEEYEGVDIGECGLEAYPEFTSAE